MAVHYLEIVTNDVDTLMVSTSGIRPVLWPRIPVWGRLAWRHTVHAFNLSGTRQILDADQLLGPGAYVYEPAGTVDA